jgi:large subunit ribosomal protein L18e
MAKRTGPTSERLKKLIIALRKASTKENAPIWKAAKKELERSTRSRREVNVDRIGRFVKDGETALVLGKVLSDGDLRHKTTVAAYSFSKIAREKINQTGKAISIEELLEKNPKGKKVRIIG